MSAAAQALALLKSNHQHPVHANSHSKQSYVSRCSEQAVRNTMGQGHLLNPVPCDACKNAN